MIFSKKRRPCQAMSTFNPRLKEAARACASFGGGNKHQLCPSHLSAVKRGSRVVLQDGTVLNEAAK